MDKKSAILDIIPQQGMLPLFFNESAEVSANVLRALYAAGIRAVEYTNRGSAALKNFAVLRNLCDTELKDMYLGIGTIKNEHAALAFINAGADFIISPGIIDEVAEAAKSLRMLWIPGCMTPTEIIKAENMGATFIKLFPGNLLGPAFVQSIKELFPTLFFMPTGGVELDKQNLEAWFNSGVCAVGMGSKLITKSLLQQKDYSSITTLTKEALETIQAIKK